jgi:hypothetical protein
VAKTNNWNTGEPLSSERLLPTVVIEPYARFLSLHGVNSRKTYSYKKKQGDVQQKERGESTRKAEGMEEVKIDSCEGWGSNE